MDESPESLTARWGRAPARLDRLESEVDETYRATFHDGSAAIVKIAVAGTEPGSLDFEGAVVDAALSADPSLPLARVIPTPLGETRLPAGGRWVRLVECLPGRDAATTTADLTFVHGIGRTAGRLTRALKGFRHPSDLRPVEWDLRRAPALRTRLALLDADLHSTVERVLDDLEAALPALAAGPAQVVHNDLNGGNILIDGAGVSGIVDFGDAAFAPRAGDVGIAMSYTLGYTSESSVWAAPAALLAGYREEVDLTPDELALLPTLVRGRVAQRVLMSVGGDERVAGEGRRDEDARVRRASSDLRRLVAADPDGEWSTA